ncbi:zinc ribbon domain-containing protein [Butyrivibrio sp. CB08]|uniref:zinc ribbon domain-containing protein n=1 Tax=Butyrivibrio sp. CB08 TaxID=2364879 RepID=UPI000EAABAB1|nr:zinc ribbon domain-containing protein [Butyrivibrio sp. CB08]RKM55372.1 zinc ribbon domain-containing protein [Butyrivibrio sp. CB08]
MESERTTEVTCQYCGAPVRTELCPYCGKPTGLNTATATMDYPEVECKEAHLDFWGIIFPLIFAVAFGFFGFIFPIFFRDMTSEMPAMKLMFLPFMLIGLGAAFIVLRNLWRYLSVSMFGKEIEGTVYGYTDDVITYNDQPGQVCKIMVNSAHGKRFIMYQLKSVKKPYKVNTTLPLKVYKNCFMIIDKHKYEIWE